MEAGENPMHVFLIAVIPKNFKDATVNLKSPLVFSYESGLAAQVILESDYPIRYPLFKKEGGGDDASSVKKAK
ncbi:MAG: flagellar assembly protein FliW [Oscillospiraceae bacterium]